MDNREGNVIRVSQEQFRRGPKRPYVRRQLAKQAFVPELIYPEGYPISGVEIIAPVIPLPNATTEAVQRMDEVLEQLVETDIIPSIIEQLEVTEHRQDAINIQTACVELRRRELSHEDISEFVIDYLQTIDEKLHAKVLLAIQIREARKHVIDLETYASS